MNEVPILQAELFAQLPPEWPENLMPAIQQRVRESGRKLVILDDDPTGTQTVHDVRVLTCWEESLLLEAFEDPSPAFFLLTNSRSLSPGDAAALNTEIGARLNAASQHSGRQFAVISRSDSTLRGHFPGEVAALAAAVSPAGETFDAWLVAPYFREGGRFTINDVHYVAEGEWLIPAGQTPFARDPSFGYHSSNLKEWVAEKTSGKIAASQVASISLNDLRLGGPERAAQKLLNLPRGSVCVVNAASDRDLEVLVLGILEAEARGRKFLYRSAASFVRVRAGISLRGFLSAANLHLPENGPGLVIAGSYVPKTTLQLENMLRQTGISAVEASVERLLNEATREGEIRRVRDEANRLLGANQDTAVFTSRNLASAGSMEVNLAIGKTISESLVAVVRGLQTRPRYLLAKGGITSSDIATRGLGIRGALVLGQILPGVPVWQAGPESRYPGLAYIVFPGNVGDANALAELVTRLHNA